MNCRGGGQTDLYCVEMIEGISPDRLLCGSVSPMTFIGDNDIKRMDGNIEPGCILLDRLVLNAIGPACIRTRR